MSKMDDEKTMIVDNEAIEEAAKESSSIAGTDLIGGSRKAIVDSKTSEPPQPKIDIEEGNLGNDSGDDEGDEEDEDDEDLDYYYYSFAEEVNDEDRINAEGQLNNNDDPEYFSYECLSPLEAENFLQDSVAVVTASVTMSPSLAKIHLRKCLWSTSDVIRKWQNKTVDPRRSERSPSSTSSLTGTSLSSLSKVVSKTTSSSSKSSSGPTLCDVCATMQPSKNFSELLCGHSYCQSCWELHFEYQILQGLSTNISCMSCPNFVPEDFVKKHLNRSDLRDKYSSASFQDYVLSHPCLRFCPGKDCNSVMKSETPLAKKCVCTSCKSAFCFNCGSEYHAPTGCETIKRWLTKCADDSETANYISAHTKDCPKCNICIEKNGGCNHMQCYNCKHDFCWMCLGDWKTHGSEYYECSRYKENPNIAHESAHAQAREALKKYLHYFERWENHSKSMKLEAQTLEKIKNRITEKVMSGSGTWIDWQYLLDASTLLAKCRYTLQYTYPYAYYMEPCPRKELFEYQQAQLEAEIENLSWKIEHAETTDRGDLENQIDIAEKRRTSLLKDFLAS